MIRHNAVNERVKREYARYLRDAQGKTESSIDTELAALARFEAHTRYADFGKFKNSQASSFKAHLALTRSGVTGDILAESTRLHTLAALKKFFSWLSDQDGYRGRLKRSDADYFSPSRRMTAIAKTVREMEGPTIEQVRHIISVMPANTDIEKRDRAVIAFALLTGARDNAIASLRMKHLNVAGRMIVQDARQVRTKGSKTIETWFFPVGEDFARIVTEWAEHLRGSLLWGLDDPLFPKTRLVRGTDRSFQAAGLSRDCWSNADPVRKIFRQACDQAGLPYFNPHSLRKTLARLGEARCRSVEEFKAWSQNLGHEKVLTTLTSYGQVERLRQRDLILGMGSD